MRYVAYKNRKGFYNDRIELLLARLAYITAGNPKAKLTDFILQDDLYNNKKPELYFDLSTFNWRQLPVKKMNFDYFKNQRIGVKK